MARFSLELPNELIKELSLLEQNTTAMMSEMTRAGAEIAYNNIKANMKNSFKKTDELEKCLKITKTYRTVSDDGINTKVAFYGYIPFKNGQKKFTRTNGKTKKKYSTTKGIPASLVAMAREYGTSHGEAKKPFVRKSFKKDQIENKMLEIQENYLPKE